MPFLSANESLVCFRLLHGFTTRQTQQTYSRRFVAPVESGELLLPVWLAGKAHSYHTWMGFPYVEQIKKPAVELYKPRGVWGIKSCQLQQEPCKCSPVGEAGGKDQALTQNCSLEKYCFHNFSPNTCLSVSQDETSLKHQSLNPSRQRSR